MDDNHIYPCTCLQRMGNKYYQPAGTQPQHCAVHLQLALVLRLWGCQFPLASAQLPVTLEEAANKKCNLHEDRMFHALINTH